ncbi:MAG: hypothetical protein RBT04_10215, partial [Sphaerochaetaceae bacterium]|nr:hypothetical protein [Sphaerochaetaceae bacterium]
MKHIVSANTVFLGAMSAALISALSGCQGSQEEAQQEPQNRFLVVEQQPNGKFVVVEEVPTTGPSHA